MWLSLQLGNSRRFGLLNFGLALVLVLTFDRLLSMRLFKMSMKKQIMLLHAVSGGDTVSSFLGHGKKSQHG